MSHNGIYCHPLYQTKNTIAISYKGNTYSTSPELHHALLLFSKLKTVDTTTQINFFSSIRFLLPTACSKANSLNDFGIPFKELKAEKHIQSGSIPETYKLMTRNGKSEKLERSCADPSYIFIGRGNHSLRGTFKPAIQQSEIVLNCSKSCIIPGKWRLVCNKNVDWIACWKDTLFNKYRYIYPHATSTLKSSSDRSKFDFARNVLKQLHKIRTRYLHDTESSDPVTQQHGIACFLIDKLLLRCGTETDDYNTFGCTTLQSRHLQLKGNRLIFNFKSKDSIDFKKSLTCTVPSVISYFKKFEHRPVSKIPLFDKISSGTLNNYLNSIVPHLTAKVFRTCHACSYLQKYLKNAVSISDFKEANEKIAKLCNHTNLNTSKGNYIDPRIIIAFSKKNSINPSNLFSPTLLLKYTWAMKTEKSFRF